MINFTQDDVLQKAMRLLSQSSMSELELTNKLKLHFANQENNEALVDQTIIRLKKLHILSDRRTAESIVRPHNNKGDRFIRQKLKSAGIDEINIAKAITELGDETIRAKEAALKKVSSYAKESSSQRETKLVRFLSSRGFSADTCYTVAKAVAKSKES